ncbi:MAG: GNAT family N-acetyltransferase [Pseudomonadota bacterium]
MRTSFAIVSLSASLIDEWTRVFAMSDARFFLSPAWVETWLAAQQDGVEIGCVRVFDDLRGVYGMGLVGLPKRSSFIALREARLHEAGVETLDRIYLEYNDILLVRDAPAGAREAAIAAIFDALPKVDEFVFRNATAPLADAVEAIASDKKFAIARLNRQPVFELRLKAEGEGFSPSLRAKIRRSIRRYEERGEVRLQRAANEAERAVAWTELMRLHAETWSRRGVSGVFSERDFRAFHERLIAHHPSAVDFLRLTAGGETVGVLYNFVLGDRVCNYQSGFRYEADNQLVPGFVAHALAAARYRDEGFAIYDLMGGDADYKRRLGVEGETLEMIVATRPGLRTKARSLARSIRRARDEGMRRT